MNYIRAPKSERSDFSVRLNWNECWFGFRTLDFRCWGLNNLYALTERVLLYNLTRNGLVHSSVWISDARYCPKSKQNRSNFRRCLKSELFDNQTIIDCPKSKRVRISVLYCICSAKDPQTGHFNDI